MSIGEKSPFHSMTRILANKRRKLVLTPFYNAIASGLHQDAVPVPPNPASIAEFEPLGTLFALTRYLPTSKISHNANRLWFPHSLR